MALEYKDVKVANCKCGNKMVYSLVPLRRKHYEKTLRPEAVERGAFVGFLQKAGRPICEVCVRGGDK